MEKINNLFNIYKDQIELNNPISSDLNVLRNSIFSNLILHLKKNIDRGFQNLSIFEIGPCFDGNKPGEQKTIVCGIKTGQSVQKNWNEQSRLVDIFDIKKDLIQTLIELGINNNDISIVDKTPKYYHPGKSGMILSKNSESTFGYFGEIHPNIIKELDINTETIQGFEINLDNLVAYKRKNFGFKNKMFISDFQKSERDFAFIIDKKFRSQDLIEIIKKVDEKLIQNVRVFDIYEGENIPNDMKSVALNVTIQSMTKTLNEKDLEKINKLIIDTVENKTGAKIRS